VLEPAAAVPPPPHAGSSAARVPISLNFPLPERLTLAGVVVVDAGLVVLQKSGWITHAPRIGDPGPTDHAVSDALYQGGPVSEQWLSGMPDRVGEIYAPLLSIGYYGLNAALQRARGRSLTGNVNADHELLAFAEAYALTFGLTQATKLAVGRERPMYALSRPGAPPYDDDATLSFFSGHSSSSFVLAAFITRDLSDWLVSGPLAGRPQALRVVAGRIAPALVLYGAAGVIALSRIIDQRHYLSDVLAGTAVGIVTGNVIYAAHFDLEGRPRQRASVGPQARIVPIPGGLALDGTF
jgi:membrane-associated phospholipid phosphatase